MKSLISILLLFILFAATSTCARAQAPQFPCEDDVQFAEFDFWIGEWDVHQSTDHGETWVSWFEGFYTRKSVD